MAENTARKDSDVPVNCKDEEMVLYKKCSVNVVNFRIGNTS